MPYLTKPAVPEVPTVFYIKNHYYITIIKYRKPHHHCCPCHCRRHPRCCRLHPRPHPHPCPRPRPCPHPHCRPRCHPCCCHRPRCCCCPPPPPCSPPLRHAPLPPPRPHSRSRLRPPVLILACWAALVRAHWAESVAKGLWYLHEYLLITTYLFFEWCTFV